MRYNLETGGMVCPFPLIEAKQKMAELQASDELFIAFDCTQGTESIPQWAAEQGYPVTHFAQVGEASWEIVVQKA